MTAEMIQRTAFYTGRVQGVGFRATTASIARGFDVAGTVENMPDGRVKVVVEGEPEQVAEFLDEVTRQLDRHIRLVDIVKGTASGAYGDPRALDAFRIQY